MSSDLQSQFVSGALNILKLKLPVMNVTLMNKTNKIAKTQ